MSSRSDRKRLNVEGDRLTSFFICGTNLTSATLTMVSLDHETMETMQEIRAVMNVASARNLMRELQELLDQWKENSEKNTADMKQDKAPIESHMTTVHAQGEVETYRAQPNTKMKWHFGERMAHIKSYWEDLNAQLEKGYKNTRHTISLLWKIEGVLKNVPRSDRAKMQARFSGLRAEAEANIDNAMDCMKIQCDKKPSCSNVFFHELATSSQQSF
ncbi:hypothetical protein L1987_17362 [Smallanthus sonchifolius]|uniref:Uncharacterized protein n=1 Tax=Smallanthus sonchifolius TaxID=185202 RepID=A0ACB9IYQ3_9ASTR|nr:hypothetical protein L1987_17362 [Smallanthus sonchifolius]